MKKTPLRVSASLLAIEKSPTLFKRLQETLQPFEFAESVCGSFLDFLPTIAGECQRKSVFLYVDPFTVDGLRWESMDAVFSLVGRANSVEVLMNFNACSFVRRGRAALRIAPDRSESNCEQNDEQDNESGPPIPVKTLDAIIGGEWWQEMLRNEPDFAKSVRDLATEYLRRLQCRFQYVCWQPVMDKPHHRVPVYYLLFGSRHPDALMLMNDAMANARDMFAEQSMPREPTLFETRPVEMIPDLGIVKNIVLNVAKRKMSRKEIVRRVITELFGRPMIVSSKEIRKCISELISGGTLRSASGKTRINDDELLWHE